MNFAECLSAARQALSLLVAHPLRWLGLILAILVVIESLMFIPYIGFVVKLAVAGVVMAQVIAIFGEAAAGQAPSPLNLLSAFSRPVSAQLALAAAALLPFVVGVLFLYLKAGPASVEFFFGNILKTKPPALADFAQFKYVMQLVGMPFTLLAGAVVIKGLTGTDALSTALAAAVANWLPVLLLGLLSVAFEWTSAALPSLMPRPAAALVGGVLLVLFLAWTSAIVYTVSAKVFAPAAVKIEG